MTLVPDWILLARDLVAQNTAMVRQLLPDATLESDGHDLAVTTSRHGGDVVERAMAIVRCLRGGRPHNPALPADWHIRSIESVLDIPMRPETANRAPKVVGTSIAFSCSYSAPAGYDEMVTVGQSTNRG